MVPLMFKPENGNRLSDSGLDVSMPGRGEKGNLEKKEAASVGHGASWPLKVYDGQEHYRLHEFRLSKNIFILDDTIL